MSKYVMCIDNEGYLVSLDLFKVYRVIEDEIAERTGMIRIIDNSGEDYVFSAKRFEPVELTEAGAKALEQVPA